jgi:hypothetical protein
MTMFTNNFVKDMDIFPNLEARKIRNYLYCILEDAWKYSHDKRPGRRKRQQPK